MPTEATIAAYSGNWSTRNASFKVKLSIIAESDWLRVQKEGKLYLQFTFNLFLFTRKNGQFAYNLPSVNLTAMLERLLNKLNACIDCVELDEQMKQTVRRMWCWWTQDISCEKATEFLQEYETRNNEGNVYFYLLV